MFQNTHKVFSAIAVTLLLFHAKLSSDSTWVGTEHWNPGNLADANNWSAGIPNGSGEQGIFTTSSYNIPTLSTNLTISNILFPVGAPAYNFMLSGQPLTITCDNGGITNHSGGQIFEVFNSGTLQLNGSSTNSVVTRVILNAGSFLVLNGNQSDVLLNVVSDSSTFLSLGNSTLFIGSNNAGLTISSDIIGSGGNITKIGLGTYVLDVTGGGKLVLTISQGGLNLSNYAYVGLGPIIFEPTITTSTSGTLIANNNQLNNPIQIANGFTAQFRTTVQLFLGGAITDLTTGGNVDILSGSVFFNASNLNTYSGTTTINASAALAPRGNNVFSPNSAVTVTGELFGYDFFTATDYSNSIFSLAGTGPVNTGLTTAGAINVVGNSSTLFSGALQGNGSLNLSGGGVLELTGNSGAYSGTTNVTNGSTLNLNGILGNQLNVALNGVLTGTGTGDFCHIQPGGVISPGNSIGTLNFTTYTQDSGSFYNVEVNLAGQSDLINVTGIAQLNGGEVVVLPIDGVNFADRYEILAAGGGVSGHFTGATLQNSRFGAFLDYSNPNAVFLFFKQLNLNGALSFNEIQVQNQLNALLAASPTATETLVLDTLFALPQDQLTEALDELSGAQYANDPYLVGLLSQQFIRRLYDPIRVLVVDPCYTPYCDGITFWAQGSWGRDLLRNNGNGFGFHTTGLDLTWGAQKTFLNDFTLGAALSYDYEFIHYNLNGFGRMNSGFLGLYALYRPDRFYAFADAAFGYTQHKVHRTVVIGDLEGDIDSRPRFYDFTAYFEIGFDLPVCNLMIQPFAAIESVSYQRDAFSEKNEPEFGLSLQKLEHTTALTRAGFHFTAYEHCWGFYFSTDITWNYRFTSSDAFQNQSFLGFGTPFTILGVPVSKNSIEGAVTLSNHITEQLRSYIEAEAEVWNKAAAFSFQVGLQYLY